MRRPLTDDELARLLEVAEPAGRKAWCMAAALAGLRNGDAQLFVRAASCETERRDGTMRGEPAGVAQLARAPAFQAGTPPCNAPKDKHFGGQPAPHQQFSQQCAEGTGTSDPDLRQVIDAWAKLPKVVRAGMLAMVKAAEGRR